MQNCNSPIPTEVKQVIRKRFGPEDLDAIGQMVRGSSTVARNVFYKHEQPTYVLSAHEQQLLNSM